MLPEQYEQTLILDNEQHLSIRLFKENDPYRKKIRPFRILSGSLHYFRVLPQLWSNRIEQMKKAGLNTIETYIPWNLHESERGVYKFNEGLMDIISFLKLVHQHEMFTIIRPSGKTLKIDFFLSNQISFSLGYICAEWEWGGLPSWLLEDETMRVRSTHPEFLQSLKNYYSNLLPILSEHQYNRHGQGSIIAFQIENEYGSYGQDKSYLQAIRAMYTEYGLDELFFTSDGGNRLPHGTLDDVWATINFQRNVQDNLKQLIQFRPNHHLMIMEYWTGWFDYWGGTHQTGQDEPYPPKEFEKDLETILLNSKYEISINFYMFFGGTNFGFTSGGHHFPSQKYSPLVTSYDYDAPMNESGDPTEKYFVIQKILQKFYQQNPHLIIYNHRRPIADTFEILAPEISKKHAYGKIKIYGYKTFEQILNDDILTETYQVNDGPLNMEQIKSNNQSAGVSQGFIVYINNEIANFLQENQEHSINIFAIADNALVLANGKLIYKSLHTDNSFRFIVPSDTKTLMIIVENMGRINYGPTLDRSRKGILDKVFLDKTIELKKWTINVLEFRQGISSITDWNKLSISEKDSEKINELNHGPQLFYAPFHIENEKSIADTYLSLDSQWTKGVAFINGFNLGRYWSIGPQRTLYIPKELLFKGFNHIQLFELYTYGKYLQLVDTPVIDA
jgi:beta-galactosidase